MRAVKSIRSVDPNHIIFLEPANMYRSDFRLKDKVVWSPHFYALSFEARYDRSSFAVLEADVAAKYQKFVDEVDGPMWIGEFGAFMIDRSGDDWLRDVVHIFAKHEIGWAWWAFTGMEDRIPSPLYVIPENQPPPSESEPTVPGTGIDVQEVLVAFAVLCGVVLVVSLVLAKTRNP